MAELQEHFKMDYKRILPNANHVIKGNKYRITVLSDLLVSIQKLVHLKIDQLNL